MCASNSTKNGRLACTQLHNPKDCTKRRYFAWQDLQLALLVGQGFARQESRTTLRELDHDRPGTRLLFV